MQTYGSIFDANPAARRRGDTAKEALGKDEPDDEDLYFPISPFIVFPEAYGEFAVYVRKGKNLILFTRQGEQFTKDHKAILHEKGVQELYIRSSQKPEYDHYIECHLGTILGDDSIPLTVRSRVFYHLATSVLGEIFETDRQGLSSASLEKLKNIVRSSLEFLSAAATLRCIVPMLSHGYGIHTHSANVFIYCTAILNRWDMNTEERLKTALGAILHDIGKSTIPGVIVNKRGRLNTEERDLMKTHPVRGVGICSTVFLGQTVIHTLLFHHEKLDGGGYPVGLQGPAIPLHARIIGVVDAFDTFTSERYFYAEPLSAEQALTFLGEELKGWYDQGVITEFGKKLQEAGIR
jgi:HD-GYP domain-containing protein (c-di-GMP phosphodiesterase class II)